MRLPRRLRLLATTPPLRACVLVVLLAGCVAPEPPPPAAPPSHACLLPSEQGMLVAELFFGRSLRGRAPLTDAEWADFAARVITPNFPAGFTVIDGEGQWQNPATGAISRERTKILLVVAPPAPDLASRLTAVIDAYKAGYRQQSVGVITRDACAAF